jgi:predicted outer membrane repeat protein
MTMASNLRVWRLIPLLLFVVVFCPFADGKIIYVDDDGQANFDKIQAAIDDANDGDTVLVTPGTYTGEGNRDIDFKGKAITVRSTDPNNLEIVKETVINCQGSEENPHRGFQFVSGEGRDSILAGFKIINGFGSEIEIASSNWSMGGAVLCLNSSPTISGCVIERNFAGSGYGWGGGIYCFNSSAAIIKCIVQYNEADSGGGIFCKDGSIAVDQCMLNSNISNHLYGGGAGIYYLNSNAAITRSIIQHNTSSGEGGGIYCEGGSVVIDQCTLSSNLSGGGGGIYFYRGTGSVLNCLINRNKSFNRGGGILYFGKADVTISNCTVVRNLGGWVGGIAPRGSGTGKPIILTNCILWGNSYAGKCEFSTQVYQYAPMTLSYCCVQGWTPDRGGDGNFGDDPLLTADFHLQADSPCIDTGDPNTSLVQSATDIDGELRHAGEQVDIGCDEYIDLDDDILPDFWELTHFETTVNVEAGQNPDEDAWTNIQEYNQSSNPIFPPATFYVDALDGDDFWDGFSPVWDGQHGPKATIQAAINQASFYDHDLILLAPGTYTSEGNRDIDFAGKVITVKSENGLDNCIIDCQGFQDEPHRGFYFHSDENLNSVLQGVTIINGYATRGGGIFCENASPQILECAIANNIASEEGGGVQCEYSNPTITQCSIQKNSACNGGGVGVGTIHSTSSLLTMTNCLVTGNTAEFDGGGIFCSGKITLLNCTIFGNRARSYYGGGIYLGVGKISNSIFYGNMAGRMGNEISQGPHGAGGCRPDLVKFTHSVVGSDPNAFDIPSCYSGEWLYADPLFVNPGYWDPNGTPDDTIDDFWIDGDYHLKSQAGRWDTASEGWIVDDVTSPCIDAGGPNMPVGDEPMPNGGRINMGAYGGTEQASLSLSTVHAVGKIPP